jgi:hypothetical protein
VEKADASAAEINEIIGVGFGIVFAELSGTQELLGTWELLDGAQFILWNI